MSQFIGKLNGVLWKGTNVAVLEGVGLNFANNIEIVANCRENHGIVVIIP